MESHQEESGTPKDRLGWTPEEVASYIRYQLSELSGTNGHHEFEALCFHLARKRIYPNIIPSTGPVSAGGDQGSDFETYEAATGGSSPFFAETSEKKVVFACSIEKNFKKKIKQDLAAIANAQPSAKKVKFFSNGRIAIGVRHKLQAYAVGAHAIELEVFDSFAISELLADNEVFWIASRFLSIPSDVFLAAPITKEPKWYEEELNAELDPARLTPAAFFRTKNAVRYATRHHSRHSDLPRLIGRLRTFQVAKLAGISRRAFYEEVVASIRGLEFVQDCSERLREYFADIQGTEGTDDIEDAAVLIHFIIGAKLGGLVNLPLEQILEWRESLLARITALLCGDVSPGRRSSLLDMQAFVTLVGWIEAKAKDTNADVRGDLTKYAELAFVIWRKMLKHVRDSPMFPLEMFARRLAFLAGEYGDVSGYSELSLETDRLLASRFGQQKLADQAYDRSISYSERGRLLDAIDQLHVAHVSSFTKETALRTVHIPLFLAKMYSETNLYAAAKYYALASCFAALKIGDDELKPYMYRGLAEAAANDHANGASLGFFLTLQATVFVASLFSASGSDKVQDFEWGRLFFYASILAYGAAFISKPLATYLTGEVLPNVGLSDLYQETFPEIQRFFEKLKSYSDFATTAISQGIAAPFADMQAVRTLAWEQLGIKWTIEWATDYETTAMAEGFVALLQILLTDLRKIELSILRGEVYLTIKLHSGELRIDEIPSNTRLIRTIYLPGKHMEPELVLGAAATILKMVSAYPHDTFLRIIGDRMRLGLLNKTNPHAPYDVLFREFYFRKDYEILHNFVPDNAFSVPAFVIKTAEGLRGMDGIHQDYDQTESRRLIQKRYRVSLAQLKYTLPRLSKDLGFCSTVAVLRDEGWKDWHILQAISNIRLNYAADKIAPQVGNLQAHMRTLDELMERDEAESDPQAPANEFSVENLKRSLRLSQISTLKGLGFEGWQPTPIHEAIDTFLRRFHYWTDDVPHPDPFELRASGS